ncbi:hypothetical protein [Pantoea vagans]|uniref:hypothetical protein n=1 Tax=Pantoea vagans TaxID=470934 RepID=UPI0028AA9F5B|nr:hypothetical protein [Pantoea vagans]
MIASFVAQFWNYILAVFAVIAAGYAAYKGGKKVGAVQTQAKADVAAAEKDKNQAEAVAKKQSENLEVAKNVQSVNSSLSDDDARSRLQRSKYNQP